MRAVKAIEQVGLDGPVDHWRAIRDTIHRRGLYAGFDAQQGALVQYMALNLFRSRAPAVERGAE